MLPENCTGIPTANELVLSQVIRLVVAVVAVTAKVCVVIKLDEEVVVPIVIDCAVIALGTVTGKPICVHPIINPLPPPVASTNVAPPGVADTVKVFKLFIVLTKYVVPATILPNTDPKNAGPPKVIG